MLLITAQPSTNDMSMNRVPLAEFNAHSKSNTIKQDTNYWQRYPFTTAHEEKAGNPPNDDCFYYACYVHLEQT